MPQKVRVAVIVRLDNGFGRDVLRGIAEFGRLHRPEWSFTFISEHWGRRGEEMAEWHEDAVIAHHITEEGVDRIRRCGLAVVTVGSWQIPSPAPQAIVDNFHAGEQAAEHFAERGVLNVAYGGAPKNDGSVLRHQGLAAGIESANGRYLGELMVRRSTSHTELGNWLASLPRPVGILGFHDPIALQVLAGARAAGLRVPDDVAVVGMNDDDVLCDLATPTLTSIDLNARRVGYEAAALLDRVLDAGPDAPRPETLVVPPVGPIIRRSTEVQAIDDPLVAQAVRLLWKHAGEGENAAEILEDLPISRRSLDRRFARVIGRPPAAELRRTRLERARRLLITSNLSIAEVAARCGYRHQSHLNYAFRKAFDTTPLEMRAAHGAPERQ